MNILDDGITVSNTDILCLRNDLIDVDSWIKDALTGKINNCKKRLIQQWMPRLVSDPTIESIPADEDDLIAFITSRPGYLNRVERDSLNV